MGDDDDYVVDRIPGLLIFKYQNQPVNHGAGYLAGIPPFLLCT